MKFNQKNRNYLISGGNDDKIFLFDLRKMKKLWKIEKHKAAVKALCWSTKRQDHFISGGGTNDRSICIWNVN